MPIYIDKHSLSEIRCNPLPDLTPKAGKGLKVDEGSVYMAGFVCIFGQHPKRQSVSTCTIFCSNHLPRRKQEEIRSPYPASGQDDYGNGNLLRHSPAHAEIRISQRRCPSFPSILCLCWCLNAPYNVWGKAIACKANVGIARGRTLKEGSCAIVGRRDILSAIR